MLTENGFRTSTKDMDFYNHHFGIASVEKRVLTVDKYANVENQYIKDQPTTLVYYRIWKNANDNIRRLLFHYSSLSSSDVKALALETDLT